MKGLFVTGTDTGVGKTVAAAALLQRYRGVAALRYWKPIQTGIEVDDDTATVRRLGAAAGQEIFEEGVRLEKPVSPHLAARWGLCTINHTLLTLEALQTRWLRVAGVLMIGEPNAENRAAIEQYGRVPVIAEMPVLAPLDAGLLGAWSGKHLDPQGRLLEFLR